MITKYKNGDTNLFGNQKTMTPEILIRSIGRKNRTWESMKFTTWNVKKQVLYKLAEEGALPSLKKIFNKNGSDYFNLIITLFHQNKHSHFSSLCN